MALAEVVLEQKVYMSGHCSIGNHENTKNIASNKEIFPACRGVYIYRSVTITCGCFCHQIYAQVKALTDASSDPTGDTASTQAIGHVDLVVPTVTPTRDDFWSNAMTDQDLSHYLRAAISKMILGKEYDGERDSESTRRPRGSLDINVEVVCRLWLGSHLPFPELTTDTIALLIDPMNQPSTGAIYAVLERWSNKGLCFVESKPYRFLRFSDAVNSRGITMETDKWKREKIGRAKGFFS